MECYHIVQVLLFFCVYEHACEGFVKACFFFPSYISSHHFIFEEMFLYADSCSYSASNARKNKVLLILFL